MDDKLFEVRITSFWKFCLLIYGCAGTSLLLTGFSPVVVSGACSLAVCRFQQLWHAGSVSPQHVGPKREPMCPALAGGFFFSYLWLHCCVQMFSSCNEQGLLFVEGCSLWGLLILGSTGSKEAGLQLFIIARTWKQPRCPSADKWIWKLWIYTMEYYSAIKKNSFESVLMRWMKLEPIIQSEVSQKDKEHYSILTHIYGI